MAQCFCGCGRKAGFGQRQANKLGGQSQERVDFIEREIRPRFDKPGSPMSRRIEQTLADGRAWIEQCKAVVHREAAFGDVDWPSFRAWFRDADGMVSFMRLSPAQQQRIMRSGKQWFLLDSADVRLRVRSYAGRVRPCASPSATAC